MTYLWLSLPPLTSSGFKMDCTETIYWLDFGCNLPGMLLISDWILLENMNQWT